MRYLTSLILFILIAVASQAQLSVSFKKKKAPVTFQKDENGKIIFYEVVSTDTVPRDTLWKNGLSWMKSITDGKTDKITFENQLYGTIEAEVGMMLYVPSLVTKMPHGRLTYKVSLDIKDKKYRYTFTDFVFQYYQQSRKDFKYKPVKGSYRPLEKEKYPGYQTAWYNHKITVKEHIDGQIANLKTEMVKINKPKPLVEEKPVIKTKDW